MYVHSYRDIDTWSGGKEKLVDWREREKKLGKTEEKKGRFGQGLTLYLVAALHIPSDRAAKSTERIDLSFFSIFFFFFRSLPTTYLVGNRDESPILTVDRLTERFSIKRFIGVYVLDRSVPKLFFKFAPSR